MCSSNIYYNSAAATFPVELSLDDDQFVEFELSIVFGLDWGSIDACCRDGYE